MGCPPFDREHVVGTRHVDLERLVVLEQRPDGAEADELAERIAREQLEVRPLGRLALLAHRLGLLAHGAVDLLREPSSTAGRAA